MIGKVTFDERSNFGPSAVFVNRAQYVAWVGPDSRINVLKPGSQAKLTLDDTAVNGVALAARPGDSFDLAIAWTGTDPQHHLNHAYGVSNPLEFNTLSFKHMLPLCSSTAPAMAAFQGKFVMAFVGTDGRLFTCRAPELQGTSNVIAGPLNEFTFAAPALAVFDNRLYLAWVGRDGVGHLNVMSTADGFNWTNKVTLGDTSKLPPALGTFDAGLALGWTGDDGVGHLNVMTSADGITFAENLKNVEGDTSIGGPSIFNAPGPVFQHQLTTYWAGTDGAHHVNAGVVLWH